MARALDELRIDGLDDVDAVPSQGDGAPGVRRAVSCTPASSSEHPELLAPAADPWLDEIAIVAAAVAHFRRVEARSAAGGDLAVPGAGSAWRLRGRPGWRA